MILEVLWIFVVLIEVVDGALLTRPHEDFMIGVSEMVSETTSKVPSAEYKDFASLGWRIRWHPESRAVYVRVSNGSIDRV